MGAPKDSIASAEVTGKTGFARVQQQFARHMRDPLQNPAPGGVEERRLQIYRDLIFNNVESFLSGGFPILRSLYLESDWYDLVRSFLRCHHCQSPYFVEIGQEFLTFLQQEHQSRECDPAFMLELAHYEWVELALDISPASLPEEEGGGKPKDLLTDKPCVSPLVWSLSYQYPVHRIGPEFQPQSAPAEPTFLLVYRNRQDDVRFMVVNPFTVRLLELLQDETVHSGEQSLRQLAQEVCHPDPQIIVQSGLELLNKLHKCDIIF